MALLNTENLQIYAPILFLTLIHIYAAAPWTFPPGCPISLFTYHKLKSYSFPKLFSQWMQPSDWPCQKRDIILDNYFFSLIHPVLMILPLKHLATCVHFSQSATVSFLVQSQAISLSKLVQQPPHPYKALMSNPFFILQQERSL